MISVSKWLSAAATTALLALGSSAPAHAVAVAPTTTFYFSGNCVDCAAAAGGSTYAVTAELTLVNYTLGQDITAGDGGNFVSFTYNGSNLVDPFTVFNGEFVSTSGAMSNIPGLNDFDITFEDGLYFTTSAGGAFEVCAEGPAEGYYNGSCSRYQAADFGTGSWSNTRVPNNIPEPTSMALLAFGLAGVGGLRRRQRATA